MDRKSLEKRRVESPMRKSPNRTCFTHSSTLPNKQRRLRSPVEDPTVRPPSPDSIKINPISSDQNRGGRTPSTERRVHSAEILAPIRQDYSPLVKRYPSPPIERPRRPRTPVSPGKTYTDKQESTEENGVFIDKVTMI